MLRVSKIKTSSEVITVIHEEEGNEDTENVSCKNTKVMQNKKIKKQNV